MGGSVLAAHRTDGIGEPVAVRGGQCSIRDAEPLLLLSTLITATRYGEEVAENSAPSSSSHDEDLTL